MNYDRLGIDIVLAAQASLIVLHFIQNRRISKSEEKIALISRIINMIAKSVPQMPSFVGDYPCNPENNDRD